MPREANVGVKARDSATYVPIHTLCMIHTDFHALCSRSRRLRRVALKVAWVERRGIRKWDACLRYRYNRAAPRREAAGKAQNDDAPHLRRFGAEKKKAGIFSHLFVLGMRMLDYNRVATDPDRSNRVPV